MANNSNQAIVVLTALSKNKLIWFIMLYTIFSLFVCSFFPLVGNKIQEIWHVSIYVSRNPCFDKVVAFQSPGWEWVGWLQIAYLSKKKKKKSPEYKYSGQVHPITHHTEWTKIVSVTLSGAFFLIFLCYLKQICFSQEQNKTVLWAFCLFLA